MVEADDLSNSTYKVICSFAGSYLLFSAGLWAAFCFLVGSLSEPPNVGLFGEYLFSFIIALAFGLIFIVHGRGALTKVKPYILGAVAALIMPVVVFLMMILASLLGAYFV